jgi:hypothetical protein
MDPERNPARRKQIQEDERIRNAVEGKFGQAKRRFSLNWVMARLAESSKTVVLSICFRYIFCAFVFATRRHGVSIMGHTTTSEQLFGIYGMVLNWTDGAGCRIIEVLKMIV